MIELQFPEIDARLKRFPFPAVDLVVGIATGGVPPACVIASLLECRLQTIEINHRDASNRVRHGSPVVIAPPSRNVPLDWRILLVDDVSVSGKTLAVAQQLLSLHSVTTFVLKGKADLVLFPDVKDCVRWPWKP